MIVSTPFAALEQRVNQNVLSHLANASAIFGAGAPVRAIFDADYVLAEVGATGMAATATAITVESSALPSRVVGAVVTVQTGAGASSWKVAEHHPDGAGLSVLLLERSA